MNTRHYTLDEHGNPKPCDAIEWGIMFENRLLRIVKQESVGKYFISTVFLGLDHNWSGKGGPVLWETMVFHPNPNPQDKRWGKVELDGYTERCSGNREQAEAMHQRVVARVKSELPAE